MWSWNYKFWKLELCSESPIKFSSSSNITWEWWHMVVMIMSMTTKNALLTSLLLHHSKRPELSLSLKGDPKTACDHPQILWDTTGHCWTEAGWAGSAHFRLFSLCDISLGLVLLTTTKIHFYYTIFLSLIRITGVIPTGNVTVNPYYMDSTRILSSIIIWNLFLNACKCMYVLCAYAYFRVSLCSWVEVYMHIREHVHMETEINL